MAIPTITSITPARGHTGGRTLVEIVGTGFKLPASSPAEGLTPTPAQTGKVLFGTTPALVVAVAGADLLYCQTPIHDPGLVGVTVQNIDANGVLIPTEQAVRANGFEFVRPDISQESHLTAAIRALLQELKRQVLDNVSFTVQTDYDDATGDLLNIAMVAKLPALVLTNLELIEQHSGGTPRTPTEQSIGDGRFVRRRAPVDVVAKLVLIGVSDNPMEILNLAQATRVFFQKNITLDVPRDPALPNGDKAGYDLDFAFGGPIAVTTSTDNSNVESFAGSLTISDILLEDIPGLPTDKPAGFPATWPHEATQELGWVAEQTVLDLQRHGQ